MAKWRVTLKPEGDGEPLSKIVFDTESDATGHIENLRDSSDEIFKRTEHNLLIVIFEEFYKDDWRELFRESLLR